MDDLIGALFLLLFAVLAGVRKLIEQRQMKQEQERPILTREELPEKTRQTLYGDAEPTPEEQEAQRRQILEQQRGPVAPPTRRQGPLAPPREVVEDTMREAREKYERARHEAQQRAAARARQQAEAEQRHAAERRAAQARQQRRQQAPRPAPRPAPPAAKRASTLFRGLDDVRRGIVLAEILGPPKGLQ